MWATWKGLMLNFSWLRSGAKIREKFGSVEQAGAPSLPRYPVWLYFISDIVMVSNIHRHFYDNDREGEAIHVLANELVPGDLVKFATGDRIPADVRLVDAVDLEVDESSLTGETDARMKDIDACRFEGGALSGEPVALAERTCIVYMGTLVRNGQLSIYREPVRIKN
jgi:hypothetical protein